MYVYALTICQPAKAGKDEELPLVTPKSDLVLEALVDLRKLEKSADALSELCHST